MHRWIIDKKMLLTDKCIEVDKIRIVFVLGNAKPAECWHTEIVKIDETTKAGLRKALNRIEFCVRSDLKFAVFGKERRLLKFALKILLYLGYSIESAAKTLGLDKSELLSIEKELEDFIDDISLYKVPEEVEEFYFANEMVKILRKMCPWDREQTHESLIPELVEEPLELAESIKRGDLEGIREELGDVLLQVLFHAVLGKERGRFDINSVAKTLFLKMKERHPHIFGNITARSSKEVLTNWEAIKNSKNKHASISKVLASLITSQDVQLEARKKGFDFEKVEQIEEKIAEELEEYKAAREKGGDISMEIGDLLFSLVNLARFLEIDPAHALFLSMEKFRRRLEKMIKKGNLSEMSAEELDKLWQESKKDENT